MKSPERLHMAWMPLLSMLLLMACSAAIYAEGTISLATVAPSSATANSVFKFGVTYTDDPQGYDPLLPESLKITVDGREFYLEPEIYEGTNIRTGVTYSVLMSAGLNMKNTPGNVFPPYPDMRYNDRLTAKSDGKPKTDHSWTWEMTYQPPPDAQGNPRPLITKRLSGTGPTVHDTFVYDRPPGVIIDRYGGQQSGSDWMYAFPFEYPWLIHADPLHVEPYYEQFPDEGTSTSMYTFRVHYWNDPDATPPKPWMTYWQDWWKITGREEYESGVTVYLRNLDANHLPSGTMRTYYSQFRGHHMYKEDLSAPDDHCVYVLRVLPIGSTIVRVGDKNHWKTTWTWTSTTNHYYEALPPGRYEYFFACSDDDFSQFGDSKDAVWPQLDDNPPLPTAPAPNDLLFWDGGLNWSSGYVDKTTYMPGGWMSSYPRDSWVGQSFRSPVTNLLGDTIYYPAYTFPQVDPGLYQVGSPPAGRARFMGTLSPYKRAVDPTIPGQDVAGMWRDWSETAGGSDRDVFTFRVNYWHSQGVEPVYVRLYIKSGWNAETGEFVGYDMLPAEGQTLDTNAYKSGVLYQISLGLGQLGYGSHCYYIEAADREWVDSRYSHSSVRVAGRVCRYPRRPDTLVYDENTFYDGLLPNHLPDGDDGLPTENDIINGPYINIRPVLTAWTVDPNSGASGTNFRFRITYTDADNQRPFSPFVIIETDDAHNTFTASMKPAEDRDVPGNSAKRFDEGKVYEFNTSSAPGLRLQPGQRWFRFAFTDDWGRQSVPNDQIRGETVYLPQNESGWAGEFRISSNSAPRLWAGTVQSPDGTSNEATMWTYKVRYTDADNQSPKYILVLIGRQDSPPDGPVVWDSGHALLPADPTDEAYTDYREYYYATRLPGSTTQPIKYYHCFVASDGVDAAEYNASTSPSSGMIWNTPEILTSVGGSTTVFSFKHKPLVTDIPPSSPLLTPTNYTGPRIYVSGVLLSTGAYMLNAKDGVVTLNSPAGGPVTSRYWFAAEPPSGGPGAVTGNTPPTLSNGQVVPAKGQSTTPFTYSVTYRDLDGQAPHFINVVIDGRPNPMTAEYGSTTYKEGVTYRWYQPSLTSGNHTFYFKASDGAALAVFEADPSTSTIDPIPGPYINDRPAFSDALIDPSGNISSGQPVTYSIKYTDKDNEGPNSGYPVVYVDNPNEDDWSGTVTAVDATFIKDINQDWTPDTFNGKAVQVTLYGTQQRIAYKIQYNTKDILYLVASDVSDVVPIGSGFTIGMLLMSRQGDPALQYAQGVVYEAKVPSLGSLGLPTAPVPHKAHFKAVVTETTMPGVTEDYTLRYPATGDMLGPTVTATPPPTNVAPTLTSGTVAPGTGTTATAFRFAVIYTDANGDAPTARPSDGVVGYMRLAVELSPDDWKTYDMVPTEAAPSYTLGAEFTYTLSGLSVGAHRFYFQASDGWVSVRLPASPSAYLTAYVSRPPMLSEGTVIPASGNTGRVYEYRVRYKDPDNNPPTSIKLVVDGGQPIEMSVPVPGADFIGEGVVYSYPLPKYTLSEGLHNYYFEASDGNGYAVYDQDVKDSEEAGTPTPKNSTTPIPPSSIKPIDGPSVHSNNPPTLSGGSVQPATGFDLDTYTYSVTYRDPDKDEPEYVEVYIDGSTSAHAHNMTKDPSNDDFINGVTYTFAQAGLAPGSHTYFFKASDWMVEVVHPADAGGNPVPRSGPTVAARATATITLAADSSSVNLGDNITVRGVVTGYEGRLLSVSLTVRVTKPDGTFTDTTVSSAANGSYSHTWTPGITGTWKAQASWAGNTQYRPSSSPERSVNVRGPSTTVSGLDMISLPLLPVSTFPDGVFGADPPFALAKWLPSKAAYKLYSLLPGIRTDYDFPGIAVGQAYWIKTLEPKTIAPNGTLVTAASYSISLAVGWSQIGSPYTWNVEWSRLRVTRTVSGVPQNVSLATAAANGWINEYGWTYDPATGNYRLVDATRSGAERYMRPWRGYWVRAKVSCTLEIPGTRSVGPTRETSAADAGPAGVFTDAKWQVRIAARNGDLRDENGWFGLGRSKAERLESPRCLENYVDLYFTDENGGMYASDLKASVSSGDEWLFFVDTDKPGEVELTWAGLDSVPGKTVLTLVDDSTGEQFRMTPGGYYRFEAGESGASRSFRIRFEGK